MKLLIPDASLDMIEEGTRKYLDSGDLEAWLRFVADSFKEQGASADSIAVVVGLADVLRGKP